MALQFETVLDPSFGYRSEGAAAGQRLTLRQAWTAARARHGDADTRLIMAPFMEGGVFRVDLVPRTGPLTGQIVEVFVDAFSGRVLRERHGGEREGIQQALGVLEALHGGKVLGTLVQALALVAGLLPMFLLVTGVIMRKRRSRSTQFH